MSETPREPLDPELLRAASRGYYEMLRDAAHARWQLAAEYGRWLLQSLLLLHAGAIAGLFTYMAQTAGDDRGISRRFSLALVCFIAGILMTLLAGFVTWLNWSFHGNKYEELADPWMIVDPSRLPQHTGKYDRGIMWTYWISIVAGWGAAVLLIVGGLVVWDRLPRPD